MAWISLDDKLPPFDTLVAIKIGCDLKIHDDPMSLCNPHSIHHEYEYIDYGLACLWVDNFGQNPHWEIKCIANGKGIGAILAWHLIEEEKDKTCPSCGK